MKKISFFIIILLLINSALFAQVGINTNNSQPDPSAMLDVKSTTKGMLIPRMTLSQIQALTTPANGLVVFNTTDNKFYAYIAAVYAWKELLYGPGMISTFICGNLFTDYRDGKTYTTVLIGNQCWMAQNMNLGTRINGSVLQSNNAIIEKYCYNDLEANCDVYGGLYQWAEMVQYLNGATNLASWSPVPTGNVVGICPTGWHIPSDGEWTTLNTFLGSGSGGKMKETGTIHWASPNTGATNTSGFTGLPGGAIEPGFPYSSLTVYGDFWSSTEYPALSQDAWYIELFYGWDAFGNIGGLKQVGQSVRCVKD